MVTRIFKLNYVWVENWRGISFSAAVHGLDQEEDLRSFSIQHLEPAQEPMC